jgi:hypothetical protein
VRRNFWTCAEVIRLKQSYPRMSEADLAKAFPRHPIGSIFNKGQSLGIRRRKGRDWAAIAKAHKPTVFSPETLTVSVK